MSQQSVSQKSGLKAIKASKRIRDNRSIYQEVADLVLLSQSKKRWSNYTSREEMRVSFSMRPPFPPSCQSSCYNWCVCSMADSKWTGSVKVYHMLPFLLVL